MTEFGLPRHPQKKGSSPDPKIRSLSWFGRPSQLETGMSPRLFVHSGVKLNSQRYIADILVGLACCNWPIITFKKFPGFCNRTLLPLTLPRSPSHGFRGKFKFHELVFQVEAQKFVALIHGYPVVYMLWFKRKHESREKGISSS